MADVPLTPPSLRHLDVFTQGPGQVTVTQGNALAIPGTNAMVVRIQNSGANLGNVTVAAGANGVPLVGTGVLPASGNVWLRITDPGAYIQPDGNIRITGSVGFTAVAFYV